MLRFTVTPRDKAPFTCSINTIDLSITTNVAPSRQPWPIIPQCPDCSTRVKDDHCKLLEALLPVIIYFSELTSHERVHLCREDDSFQECFYDTAQTIGFILCVYASLHSGCIHFNKYRFLLKYYRINAFYETYLHILLTAKFLEKEADKQKTAPRRNIFIETWAMSQQLTMKIHNIFDVAKRINNKDAAINALNIMLNIGALSSEHLKEYYEKCNQPLKRAMLQS